MQSLKEHKHSQTQTCSDEVPECWTNQTPDTLPEIQAASTVQHVVSEEEINNIQTSKSEHT